MTTAHEADVIDLVSRSRRGFVLYTPTVTQVSLGGPLVGMAGPDSLDAAWADLLKQIINEPTTRERESYHAAAER